MIKRLSHLYGFYSRLGLLKAPLGSSTLNLGVEEAPYALVSKLDVYRLSHLGSNKNQHSYTFPLPETVSENAYLQTLAYHSQQAQKLITGTAQANETIIALGGDHSIAFASVQAILELKGAKNCGVLIFDSHADLHQPSTSPSGNFHGMWLRPFLDKFEDVLIDVAVPQKLQPNQVLFVGNLLTEPAEQEFISSQGVENISLIDEAAQHRLDQFLRTYHHIHVSFDIDVFSSAYVPGVGTPNPSGLTPSQVWPLLRQIKTHPSISLDMVEVNPSRHGSAKTVRLAIRVLQELLR